MVQIYDDETLDDLLIKDLKIIQKENAFRFTLDSVLLAHFATVKEKDLIVDLGTGTGIIPLILTTRIKNAHIIGVEIQADIAEMAKRSIVLNQLESAVEILPEDIRNVHKHIQKKVCLVTANPPYWPLGKGEHSPLLGKAIACHELSCVFEDIVSSASKLLNFQGRFAFIHRSERLGEIISLLKQYRLEPRRIRFVHSFVDKPAQHVLIEARKSAPPELKVLPPLIVYQRPACYSEEINKWYGRED